MVLNQFVEKIMSHITMLVNVRKPKLMLDMKVNVLKTIILMVLFQFNGEITQTLTMVGEIKMSEIKTGLTLTLITVINHKILNRISWEWKIDIIELLTTLKKNKKNQKKNRKSSLHTNSQKLNSKLMSLCLLKIIQENISPTDMRNSTLTMPMLKFHTIWSEPLVISTKLMEV